MRERPRRIRHVLITRPMPALAQSLYRSPETSDLFIREAIEVRIICRREMRHHTVHTNILECSERVDKIINLVITHAETTHARINFEMHVRNHLRLASRAVKRLNHVQPVNNRYNRIIKTKLLLTLPKAAEREDWLHYACAS